MNSALGANIAKFFLLFFLQVLICDHINFLGYINPYVYILFILIFPIRDSRILLLLTSFTLGLAIDFFSDSGGVHAAASVGLAYMRPLLLKTAFGIQYTFQNIKFYNVQIGNLIFYVALAALCHHLILFTLEIFSISAIPLLVNKTLTSTIFTTVVGVLLIQLFSSNKK